MTQPTAAGKELSPPNSRRGPPQWHFYRDPALVAQLCLNVGGKGSEQERGWPDSRGGDGAEALLPGRVPDLQLHFLPVDLHSPNLKIHSDRGDVTACTHTDVSRAHRPP